MQTPNFGNGRFVDNIFQETLIKLANNNNLTDTITENDIPTVIERSSKFN